MSSAPWLDLALEDLGTKEIVGAKHNPEVVAYFKHVGRPDITNDETAWCAAAQGSWLKRTGYPIPPPNMALLARTYETYGIACDPQPGAIGIWPRGNADWQGHVATVIDVDHGRGVVRRISGNLRNAVTVDEAPIDTALGFRWPVAPTVKALRPHSSTIKSADAKEKIGIVGTFFTPIFEGFKALVEGMFGAPQPPQFASVVEGLSWWQTVLDQAGRVGNYIVQNPSMAAIMLLGVGIWVWSAMDKKGRIAEHANGRPIGSELQGVS
jgi:uncharacterized protein (TIGR02594 family)